MTSVPPARPPSLSPRNPFCAVWLSCAAPLQYGRWLFCEKLRKYDLGRLDASSICHRPIDLLNGLQVVSALSGGG